MKLIKLTAIPFLIFMSTLVMVSCEPDAELRKTTDFSKTGIALTSAQETPPVSSSATGSLDVFYSKGSKTLVYTVNWTGLTDSVEGMHIHGVAPTGFAAGIVQNIVATSSTIFPQKTAGKFTFAKSGKLSGTLLVDGSLIKENDLLNGFYYVNIHTASFPGGEIRGQIRFQ